MPTDQNGTAYDILGPDGAPWVVLIHGLGLDRRVWDGMVDALAPRYRLLAYDLLGHGGSAKVRVPDLTALARQTLAVMDDAGVNRAALVGFSLGGMINRRVAMDAPGRVVALGVLNSPHDRGAAEQARVEARAAASAEGPAATLDAAIARWFTPEFIAAHPNIIAETRRTVLANPTDCYADCRRILAEGVKELIRPDPPLTHPTLVMTCQNDSGSTPAMSHAIAAEIPAAALAIVPNLQHMGLVERPELFSGPLLEFLEQSQP